MGGVILTITPNALVGPYDATRFFKPLGTKPQGFHFHEYTLEEIQLLYEKYGFMPDMVVWRGFIGVMSHKLLLFSKFENCLFKIKLWIEKIVTGSPYWMRRLSTVYMAGNVTVFRKF